MTAARRCGRRSRRRVARRQLAGGGTCPSLPSPARRSPSWLNTSQRERANPTPGLLFMRPRLQHRERVRAACRPGTPAAAISSFRCRGLPRLCGVQQVGVAHHAHGHRAGVPADWPTRRPNSDPSAGRIVEVKRLWIPLAREVRSSPRGSRPSGRTRAWNRRGNLPDGAATVDAGGDSALACRGSGRPGAWPDDQWLKAARPECWTPRAVDLAHMEAVDRLGERRGAARRRSRTTPCVVWRSTPSLRSPVRDGEGDRPATATLPTRARRTGCGRRGAAVDEG